MAWTTPPAFVASTIVTAAEMNIISGDLTYLKGQTDGLVASAVKLNRTSSQSIPDNTWTAITWNNQIGDLGGWWSSGTNIVMPSDYPAGVTSFFVDIAIAVAFAANASGTRGIRTLQNGSVVEQYSIGAPPDVALIAVPTSMFTVNQADIITMEVFQNSGGALAASQTIITCVRLFPSA